MSAKSTEITEKAKRKLKEEEGRQPKPTHESASSGEKMYVINRNGEKEDVRFDRITDHIKILCGMDPVLNEVDPALMAQKVIDSMIPGITTTQIDHLLSEEAACMGRISEEYVVLAARVAIYNIQKDVGALYGSIKHNTPESVAGCTRYADVVHKLYHIKYSGYDSPLVSKKIYDFMCGDVTHFPKPDRDCIFEKRRMVESAIRHMADYESFTYFAITTLARKYLNKDQNTNKILELPQHVFMTVSLGVHGPENIKDAIKMYKSMSNGYYIHATPTLLNGGRRINQLASCYLLTMREDSLEGIGECMIRCMRISQGGGGIGISFTPLRARGSPIKKFNGTAHGVCHELLQVFNYIARYVDQGGGKRKGAFAAYLEPWHLDVEEFIDLKATSGKMEHKCNDLHIGLFVNDLFMERVLKDEKWSLFCPSEVPELVDSYGEEFNKIYEKAETDGKARKTIRAVDLWHKIVDKQEEISEPYIVYKDACNRKSNQKNLGTIRNSNLCCEIVEYSSGDEIAVCMLASISLPKYVFSEKDFLGIQAKEHDYTDREIESCEIEGTDGKHYYDFFMLEKKVREVVGNINREIDTMWYPDPAAERSNKKHRPIGIGVQGLADVFGLCEIAWETKDARILNQKIFKYIYKSAVKESLEIAKKTKSHYSSFSGSPASKGLLQPHLWVKEQELLEKRYLEMGENPDDFFQPTENIMDVWIDDEEEDANLLEEIKEHGLANSLLVAPMPTASTSQIMGNNECFEPYTSNMYTRATNAGDFVVYNKHLVNSLKKRNLWDKDMRNALYFNNGSVQDIERVPDDLKKVFKTVWEIKQTWLIEMAADRAPFIDQSHSLNLHIRDPDRSKLTTAHFLGWKRRLKTGSYYIRRLSEKDATRFNVVSMSEASNHSDIEKRKRDNEHEEKTLGVAESKKRRIKDACFFNPNKSLNPREGEECEMCSS